MNLDELRKEIDSIDRTIVEAINERYKLVCAIGEWKRKNNMPVYVPEREKQLLDRLTELNPGPMPTATLLAIYTEIISGARRLEEPLSVACLGPLGTYTSEAAVKKFGHCAVLRPVSSIGGIFREVEAGRADYGCVPVENTTEGVVNPTLDSLRDTSLKIVAELNLPIHHQLLGNGKKEDLHCIYSHPQALAQCRAYLDANFPGVSRIEVTSTTRAAELAAHEQGAAAIAGESAAKLFQLPILADNIEDIPGNTTRFLIIANQETEPTGNDRTSICFILKDRAGALFDALAPLQNAGVSMSLIESRPLPASRWEYCFFVDLLGHRKDPVIAKALAELEERCATLKIFGSYPCAQR